MANQLKKMYVLSSDYFNELVNKTKLLNHSPNTLEGALLEIIADPNLNSYEKWYRYRQHLLINHDKIRKNYKNLFEKSSNTQSTKLNTLTPELGIDIQQPINIQSNLNNEMIEPATTQTTTKPLIAKSRFSPSITDEFFGQSSSSTPVPKRYLTANNDITEDIDYQDVAGPSPPSKIKLVRAHSVKTPREIIKEQNKSTNRRRMSALFLADDGETLIPLGDEEIHDLFARFPNIAALFARPIRDPITGEQTESKYVVNPDLEEELHRVAQIHLNVKDKRDVEKSPSSLGKLHRVFTNKLTGDTLAIDVLAIAKKIFPTEFHETSPADPVTEPTPMEVETIVNEPSIPPSNTSPAMLGLRNRKVKKLSDNSLKKLKRVYKRRKIPASFQTHKSQPSKSHIKTLRKGLFVNKPQQRWILKLNRDHERDLKRQTNMSDYEIWTSF